MAVQIVPGLELIHIFFLYLWHQNVFCHGFEAWKIKSFNVQCVYVMGGLYIPFNKMLWLPPEKG